VTYLDHGGTTLSSKTLMDAFCGEMKTTLLANPHSDASDPSPSSNIVAETRLKALELFNADPDDFDIIFTANATAAVKLVMESFSGLSSGFDYLYHHSCHTSLVGVRELSSRAYCLASDDETEEWLDGRVHPQEPPSSNRPTIFAYAAQSNMNGQRLPLEWCQQLRASAHHARVFTLLDVASFVSTSPLDLSSHASAPDFTVLSFYKLFGFPDLGALIVRKASSGILEHRRYFGGGTVEMTTCSGEVPWVIRKDTSIHARLEDGTLPVRSILALRCAMYSHGKLFGGIEHISKHTAWLVALLYARLSALKHADGTMVCHIYKAPTSTFGDPKTQGATVAFNVRDKNGAWVSPYEVGSILRKNSIYIRTGGLCNPAGMASALGLSSSDMQAAFDEGFRCNQSNDVRANGEPIGMLRVTIGAMSTLGDIDRFAECIEQQLIERRRGTQKTPEADEELVKDSISLDTKPKTGRLDGQRRLRSSLRAIFFKR
jgi:molybdenum cofactor sulfurtransferase